MRSVTQVDADASSWSARLRGRSLALCERCKYMVGDDNQYEWPKFWEFSSLSFFYTLSSDGGYGHRRRCTAIPLPLPLWSDHSFRYKQKHYSKVELTALVAAGWVQPRLACSRKRINPDVIKKVAVIRKGFNRCPVTKALFLDCCRQHHSLPR